LRKLSPKQRGRFYRYLNDSFGEHFPEFVAIFHYIDTSENAQFLRVKELFESLEAFKAISTIILTAQQQGRRIDKIYDMACGHGLVGILLAYRFPLKEVVLVDLERRPAFDAYLAGWQAKGFVYEKSTPHDGVLSPLMNVEYRQGDLRDILREEVGPTSLCISIHGCNEANVDVVQGARAKGALWTVMPCCIRKGLVLPESSIEIDDNIRYTLLCGAFATENGAQIIRKIDSRITARPIIISGGLDRATATVQPTTTRLRNTGSPFSPGRAMNGRRPFLMPK
jgi:hypothetical protein